MPFQLAVGIDEEGIGDVEAQGCGVQVQLFEQSRRACVAQRNVLHTHETAIGHAILRKVVGVIRFLDVLFAHFGDEFLRWQRGNIRAQLVAWVEPAVVILL